MPRISWVLCRVSGRMAACLRLARARGVSWVTAPQTMNFYPGECWSSWARRCPRSPVAGTVSAIRNLFGEAQIVSQWWSFSFFTRIHNLDPHPPQLSSGATRWPLFLPLKWCMRSVATATASWALDCWEMPGARVQWRPDSWLEQVGCELQNDE